MFTSLTSAEQNKHAHILAEVIDPMNKEQVAIYAQHQMHVDLVERINGVKSDTPAAAFASLHATHGNTAVGAYGSILTVGMALATLSGIEIIPQGGDIVNRRTGRKVEVKTSVRGWREGNRAGHMFNFQPSQYAPERDDDFCVMNLMNVEGNQVRNGFITATMKDIREASLLSAQKDKFTLGLPVNIGSGVERQSNKYVSTFEAMYTEDLLRHRVLLMNM